MSTNEIRIDVLLDRLCLVKNRSIAKKACDNGLVEVNGVKVKPSKRVKSGDIIRVLLYGFITEFELMHIPKGWIKKKDTPGYYRLLARNQSSNLDKP
jgi:ribosome-associated heat shock protein Hsp15